jgi:hypothetical protein
VYSGTDRYVQLNIKIYNLNSAEPWVDVGNHREFYIYVLIFNIGAHLILVQLITKEGFSLDKGSYECPFKLEGPKSLMLPAWAIRMIILV